MLEFCKLKTRMIIGSVSLTSALIMPVQASEIDVEPSARYRLLQVNDVARGNALASTLKLRLSASWSNQSNFESLVQADYVHAFNENDYNSVTVTRATSPIPDVPGAELNQAWIKYTSNYNWHAKLGRQIINLDNERHISSVEFWQNDQSFDALSVVYDDSTTWKFSYIYLNKVHRIFSDDAVALLPPEDIRFTDNPNRPFLELGNHKHDSHLLNLNYSINRYLGVSFYAYLLENKTAQQLSSDTYGIRLDGEIKPGAIKYGYTGEYAYQKTGNKSPWDFAGSYAFLEFSAQYKSQLLAISYERLEQDNGFAFATSLGNNHLFLGWADIFTNYFASGGIEDTFITYRGRKSKLRWRTVLHQFTNDNNGEVIGRELDVEIAYRFNRDWELTLLHAMYFSEEGLEGLIATQNDLQSTTLSLSYQF